MTKPSPPAAGQAEDLARNAALSCKAGNRDEGIRLYLDALRLDPNHVPAIVGLGQALLKQKRNREAATLLEKACRRLPKNAILWNELATALRVCGKHEQALTAHERALALAPDSLIALASRGFTHLAQLKLADARHDFENVLQQRTGHADPHIGLATTCYLQGDLDIAEQAWLKVLAIENPELAWNLSMIAFRRGEWRRGWLLGEARFTKNNSPVPEVHHNVPVWTGGPINGELIVWGDQGLGDQLMFARFLPLLRQYAPQLCLEVSPPLVRLMASSFPDIPVHPLGKTPEKPDQQRIALGSLPAVLQLNTPEALGEGACYLHPDPAIVTRWRNRLPARNGLRVGLVWTGNSRHPNDALRSAGLTAFAPILSTPGCEFHAIQMGSEAVELAGTGLPVIDWSSQLGDMQETAALLLQLDLLISIDSSVAHLAGSLGCPVWLLPPFSTDWRWGNRDSGQTHWYPKHQLFHSSAPASWTTAIAAIAAELKTLSLTNPPPHTAPRIPLDDLASCQSRLQNNPLDPEALDRLALLTSQLPSPQPCLPFLHRGRSRPFAALALVKALTAIGKQQAALQLARTLCRQCPTLPGAFILLSDLARRLNDADEAIAAAKEAVRLAPEQAETWLHLANAHHSKHQKEEAFAAIDHALLLAPKDPSIHNNLGVLRKEYGDLDGAIAAYRQALDLRPDYAAVLGNLGLTLREQDRLEESLQCFRKLQQLTPGNPEVWFGTGNTLKEMGKTKEAIAAYRQALLLQPGHLEVQVNLSLLLLLSGEFDTGWELYEQRFNRPKSPAAQRPFTQPRWQGQAIPGKSLLIWGEQGAGDKIMAARLIGESRAAGTSLIVETDPRLLRLMQANYPDITWLAESTPPDSRASQSDYQIPLLSLGKLRRRTLIDFGDGCAYLQPLPGSRQIWEERLKQIPGLRVGLVWAGSSGHHNDRHRSLSLASLAPLFDVPDISFISLQVGEANTQAQLYGAKLHDWTSELADYADTAALLASLDLLISVDTSVAHLGGALGVPTWILLPFQPDWRWLEIMQEHTPWYSSVRLFRQTSVGHWDDTVGKITTALRNYSHQNH